MIQHNMKAARCNKESAAATLMYLTDFFSSLYKISHFWSQQLFNTFGTPKQKLHFFETVGTLNRVLKAMPHASSLIERESCDALVHMHERKSVPFRSPNSRNNIKLKYLRDKKQL